MHYGNNYTPKDLEHPVSVIEDGELPRTLTEVILLYNGVDRVTFGISDLINRVTNIGFSNADQLWTSLREKMAAKIAENGGAAQVVPPTISRPNYKLIKDVIEDNISKEIFNKKSDANKIGYRREDYWKYIAFPLY
ncbi:hypothetical protein [Chitinophaga sp. OAE865]|uniref:hypothetical protein n=1 Tax=Chitinophaga sp. OAE865 TaxID=2817898 RepID=UPI001AE5C96F